MYRHVFRHFTDKHSFAQDLFYDCAPETVAARKRRTHFHDFMLSVHQRIHVRRQGNKRGDPIPDVAREIAQESLLLCFDEFQVGQASCVVGSHPSSPSFSARTPHVGQ
jgi:hypothetical protein